MKNGQKYFQMHMFVFFCQILALQDSLSEKNSPPSPLGLFGFAAAVLGTISTREDFVKGFAIVALLGSWLRDGRAQGDKKGEKIKKTYKGKEEKPREKCF